jgi:NAD(P)-dependent dehydrogenase (short-subunit alcohol dehydrogenase family)
MHSIVIGGTRGLGRVVGRRLAERGAVSLIGRRPPPAADLEVAGIRSWVADILEPDALARVLDEALAAAGAPSYVVFCQRYRGEQDPWRGELEATLTATKSALERLAPDFATNGDRAVVMVSSVFSDFVGEGQQVGYHVAKAGLNQLMRYYAVALGRHGIRVNGVTPFTFLKEESRRFYLENTALLEAYREMVPLGRMATSEEIADVILFLCSSQAAFVNGQNLYVDGGLSLVWPETLVRRIKGV